MHPMPVVMPAVTIDATAIMVMLSIICPLVVWLWFQVWGAGFGLGLRVLVAAAM